MLIGQLGNVLLCSGGDLWWSVTNWLWRKSPVLPYERVLLVTFWSCSSVCQGSCTDGKMGICTGKSEIQAGPWEPGLCYWPEPYFKDEWHFWWGQLMQLRGWAVSGHSCCGNAESAASVWERSGIGSISRWVSVYQTRSTNTASTNCPEPGEREELIGENWAV